MGPLSSTTKGVRRTFSKGSAWQRMAASGSVSGKSGWVTSVFIARTRTEAIRWEEGRGSAQPPATRPRLSAARARAPSSPVLVRCCGSVIGSISTLSLM